MVLANVLQPLIDIFGPVLVLFHSIIGGSWGWSIIALTVVVRGLLLPLAFKQMHSMQKLQQAAPHMKAILREDICPGLQAAFRHAFAAHHNGRSRTPQVRRSRVTGSTARAGCSSTT
jgi:60Kd inner membrane protein